MALVGRFEVKFAFFFLGLALFSCGGQGAIVFDVTKYGAKADGQTECAQAFVQTWIAACKSMGPSHVLIPRGTYMSGEAIFWGPCNHSKPITLEVQGTILANPDTSEYPNSHWLRFENLDGLVLKGGATFKGPPTSSRHFMEFDKVNNSIVQGVNMVSRNGFELKISGSHNLTLQNLHITAPKNSPSTDGIHISKSNLVTISKCTIATGGKKCVYEDEGATHITASTVNCIAPHA
ncbi:exopolygalacturonase clone GBGE184-like [Camellia sinensis]|uniref:exopolygalacturonase clone GBGE184-like n=1 Tax=Camellia sinensis TaxID=4442 RepID=UPI0010359683|nr:exopolygalacturonase clone GBGE184-like [Camellia sinensis]